MTLQLAYSSLLVLSVFLMSSQVLFSPKRVEHILFAIFCGSLAMVAIQNLTADSVGPYQYIIAMGACGTCNVIWLLARALFRKENSLSFRHYAFAGLIAGLVIINRSLDFMATLPWIDATALLRLDKTMGELTQFLSSVVLALTFWEAQRNFSACSSTEKWQRVLFSTVFFLAVFNCSILAYGVLNEAQFALVFPWFVVVSAMSILCVLTVVLVSQARERTRSEKLEEKQNVVTSTSNDDESDVYFRIEQLMASQKPYLQVELKLIDVANKLNVSEYRVSRAIRNHSSASNFNQYINEYRLAHAKQLLCKEDTSHWTILVISLESGFASLAPFNRAFKAKEGCTPNQFRSRIHANINAV